MAAPKRERQMRDSRDGNTKLIKQKVMKPSDVRLKVRNLDEKQVTNEELKVSIQHNILID